MVFIYSQKSALAVEPFQKSKAREIVATLVSSREAPRKRLPSGGNLLVQSVHHPNRFLFKTRLVATAAEDMRRASEFRALLSSPTVPRKATWKRHLGMTKMSYLTDCDDADSGVEAPGQSYFPVPMFHLPGKCVAML